MLPPPAASAAATLAESAERAWQQQHFLRIYQGLYRQPKTNPPCQVCGEFIEGRRPYCVNHSPYAQSVEDAMIDEQLSPLNIHGITARDIYNTLKFEGPLTAEGLARELNRNKEVIKALVGMLVREGIIRKEGKKLAVRE